MAGAGPPPNPNARRANKRTDGFVTLPAGRPGSPPKLPGTKWTKDDRDTWRRWWASPQATQWTDDDVLSLTLALRLYQSARLGSIEAAKEFRQWADRFGLHPLARLRNRWVVEAGSDAERGAEAVEASVAGVIDLASRRSG